MLLEELGEGGYGNVEGVFAIVLLDANDFRLLFKAAA